MQTKYRPVNNRTFKKIKITPGRGGIYRDYFYVHSQQSFWVEAVD